MNFDIVIPTKNRPKDLDRLLQSINKSTFLPQRVVIVDQSSTLSHPRQSELFEVVHLHSTEVSGLTAAKNKGVKYCTSDIIHFFDDDIIVDPDYFECINKHFEEHPEFFGICGRQKNSKSSIFKVLTFSLFHIGPFKDIRKKCNSGFVHTPLKETNVLPGGITAYRKEVFSKFSFDEALIKYCLGEDMDFSYRVSKIYKLAFATDALALHNHSSIGRYDVVESFACKVAGYSYFFRKNTPKTFYDWVSYVLVLIGVWCDALFYAITHKTLESFTGFNKGIRYISNHFKNVPFLDVSKIKF